MSIQVLKDLGSWLLQVCDLPLKKTLSQSRTFQNLMEYFRYDANSHGAIIFTKRPRSLSSLLAPKGWTHVAVFDYKRQAVLDYYFEGVRYISLTDFFSQYTETLVFQMPKDKEKFFEIYSHLLQQQSYNDSNLLCTGLIEKTNLETACVLYEGNRAKNPAPYTIIKQLKKRHIEKFHYKAVEI